MLRVYHGYITFSYLCEVINPFSEIILFLHYFLWIPFLHWSLAFILVVFLKYVDVSLFIKLLTSSSVHMFGACHLVGLPVGWQREHLALYFELPTSATCSREHHSHCSLQSACCLECAVPLACTEEQCASTATGLRRRRWPIELDFEEP